MATAKKFGTFGGVFTPSILTILGVIMYMRLPWITGQAGLVMTIGIILVAHLISITTGLSVSSIATDKKVKAGGTYYMISRSLGLPIGGTLGLALFVGLSFSVSLYLIGFSESFLNYWGFPLNINTIRLTGTIVLIAVTTLTLFSTSLAIKTQYLIMSAIGLSLLSILIGNSHFQPESSVISSIPDSVPFIVLFGIFFPAVTGFESGVSMSGDLRDPKRSIPFGTITAIGIGLITYLGLAWYFSSHVRSDLLVNDSQILLKISYIPGLVIAGIWGATLSSALGSILGAPRILQATAQDRITPSFFGKGYGDSNEPRHALMLTFIIAEIGILIGELDIIARVVSMFFITTYGFLNLSCAIERWASSDFHPDFKVPGLVSLIGAAACFIVMIQLDFIAMIGAALILGALFLYLKNRELTLESGDTWEGIWASLIRTGLTRLGGRIRTARNWRPNIILFSGGIQTRPHLIEIGRAIAGKLGIISSFDLVEDSNTELLFSTPSADHTPQSKTTEQGLFTKQLLCKDIFEGIQSIARIYGFTGIEPNTILMGWSDDANHSQKFTQLIHDLNKLDYNSIFLDFDKQSEFGQHQTIDLWWKGSGRNFSFALTILRFFKSDAKWKDARLRVIFISEQPADTLKIHRTIQQILQDYRIQAEIKIIQNTSDPKPIQEIMAAESARTDLTIMGISGDAGLNPTAYVSRINQFVEHIGSVMLIHASSFFSELDVGLATHSPLIDKPLPITPLPIPVLPAISDPEMMPLWEKMDHDMTRIISSFHDDVLIPISEKYHHLFQAISQLSDHNSPPDKSNHSSQPSIKPADRLCEQLENLTDIIEDIQTGINQEFNQNQQEAIERFNTMIDDMTHRQSDSSIFQEMAGQSETRIGLIDRLKKRFSNHVSTPDHLLMLDEAQSRKMVSYYINHRRKTSAADILNRYGLQTLSVLSELKLILLEANNTLDRIELPEIASPDSIPKIVDAPLDSLNRIQALQTDFKTFRQNLLNQLIHDWRSDLSEMIRLTGHPVESGQFESIPSTIKSEQARIDYLNHFPSIWNHDIHQMLSNLSLNSQVAQLKIQLRNITHHMISEFSDYMAHLFLDRIDQLELDLSRFESGEPISFQVISNESSNPALFLRFESLFNAARELYKPMTEQIEIPSDEFFSLAEQGKFTDCEPIVISFRRLIEHLIETDYIEPIQAWIDQNSTKLDELSIIIRNTINHMNFTIGMDGDKVRKSAKPGQALIRSLKPFHNRFSQLKSDLLKLRTDFENRTRQSLISATEPISSYSIINTSDRLNRMIWHTGRERMLSGLAKSQAIIRQSIQQSLIWLIQGRSRSVLLANRQKADPLDGITKLEPILDLVRSINPDPTIYNRIPYHYQKLFSVSSHISHEFRVAMKRETDQATSAIRNYQAGYSGGLLVLGERNSGKSTLSRIIANQIYKPEHTIMLQPPQSNSARLETFERLLQRSFKNPGTIREWIASVPLHSAIIIDDLELWWERSETGLDVIRTIAGLIRDYSDRLLFIINADLHAFKLINSIYPLDQLFISIIRCEPFDSESLKQAIMVRHASSGMKFRIGHKMEEEMNAISLARLFDEYFRYSNGRIGIALTAWISNIVEVNQSTIALRHPILPKAEILANLSDDQLVYLGQIALHRRITTETMTRLMKTSSSVNNAMIRSLLRCGMITEKSPGVYGITMTLEPYLTDQLCRKRILP